MRRRVGHRALEQRVLFAMVAEPAQQALEERRGSLREQVAQQMFESREMRERGAQLNEVARTGRAQRDAREDPLQVADAAQ